MGIAEALIDSTLMLAMGRIKVILDAIIRPAGQILGDIGPFVAEFFVEVKNFLLLHFVDRCLVDERVQVIVPSGQNNENIISLMNLPAKTSYLSRHCLPVRVRILNFSSSLFATKVHFRVPYSLTSSTIASSSYTIQTK